MIYFTADFDYWKVWIQKSHYTLGTNFVSSQLHTDMTLGANALLLLYTGHCLDNPTKPFYPCLMVTDLIEHIFGQCRELVPGKPAFDFADFLRRMKRVMHDVSLRHKLVDGKPMYWSKSTSNRPPTLNQAPVEVITDRVVLGAMIEGAARAASTEAASLCAQLGINLSATEVDQKFTFVVNHPSDVPSGEAQDSSLKDDISPECCDDATDDDSPTSLDAVIQGAMNAGTLPEDQLDMIEFAFALGAEHPDAAAERTVTHGLMINEQDEEEGEVMGESAVLEATMPGTSDPGVWSRIGEWPEAPVPPPRAIQASGTAQSLWWEGRFFKSPQQLISHLQGGLHVPPMDRKARFWMAASSDFDAIRPGAALDHEQGHIRPSQWLIWWRCCSDGDGTGRSEVSRVLDIRFSPTPACGFIRVSLDPAGSLSGYMLVVQSPTSAWQWFGAIEMIRAEDLVSLADVRVREDGSVVVSEATRKLMSDKKNELVAADIKRRDARKVAANAQAASRTCNMAVAGNRLQQLVAQVPVVTRQPGQMKVHEIHQVSGAGICIWCETTCVVQ